MDTLVLIGAIVNRIKRDTRTQRQGRGQSQRGTIGEGPQQPVGPPPPPPPTHQPRPLMGLGRPPTIAMGILVPQQEAPLGKASLQVLQPRWMKHNKTNDLARSSRTQQDPTAQ